MRLSELVAFISGFFIMSLTLFVVPTITMFPIINVIYKDDNGVCYSYDRVDSECETDQVSDS